MGVPVIETDAVRYEDFEGTPTFASIGGGAGAGKELVTFYQGVASGSRKVTSSTGGGFKVQTTGSPSVMDLTDVGTKKPMFKFFLSDYLDLNDAGLTVGTDDASTGSTWRSILLLSGWEFFHQYPATRSWLISRFSITLGWQTEAQALTTPTYPFITAAVATGAAKAENLFLDSIDLSSGLFYTDGVGDPAGFETFWAFDEGTANNRYGHVIQQEGIYYVTGVLAIGRTIDSPETVQTEFLDQGNVLVFPDNFCFSSAGTFSELLQGDYNNLPLQGSLFDLTATSDYQLSTGLVIDLSDTGTDVTFSGTTFNSRGRGAPWCPFDAANDVDATNDVIRVYRNEWESPQVELPLDFWKSGDPVYYSTGDNSPIDSIGPPVSSSGTAITCSDMLHIRRFPESPQGTRFHLYGGNFTSNPVARFQCATNGVTTDQYALTAKTGTHYIKRQHDTRAELVVEAINAAASPLSATIASPLETGKLTIQSCAFRNFKSFLFLPNCEIRDSSIVGTDWVVQCGALFDGCTFEDFTTSDFVCPGKQIRYEHGPTGTAYDPWWDAIAMFWCNDPSRVQNCSFIQTVTWEGGHGIMITEPGTYSFVGNTFTGFGADGTTKAAIYNNSGGLVTLNISGGGDTPTVRNAAGSTTVINNTVTLSVRVLDADNNPVENARVAIYDNFTTPGTLGDELLDPDGGGRRFQDDPDGTANYLVSPNFSDISTGYATSSTHFVEFKVDKTLLYNTNSPDVQSLINITNSAGDVTVSIGITAGLAVTGTMLDVTGIPVIRTATTADGAVENDKRYRAVWRVDSGNFLIAVQEVGVTNPSPRSLGSNVTSGAGTSTTGKLRLGNSAAEDGQYGGKINRYVHNTDVLSDAQIYAILDGGEPGAAGTVAEEYDFRSGALGKTEGSPEDTLTVAGGGKAGVPWERGGGLLTDANGVAENTGYNFVGGSPNIEPVVIRVRKSSTLANPKPT